MSDMKITSNNVPRPLIGAHELFASEREEFGYLDWPAIERGEGWATFVRYRGTLYSVSDFSADYGIMRGTGLPDAYCGWDGYLSESAFSAVVIRYVWGNFDYPDGEYVVLGYVTC
jgi:hypothetical protein